METDVNINTPCKGSNQVALKGTVDLKKFPPWAQCPECETIVPVFRVRSRYVFAGHFPD